MVNYGLLAKLDDINKNKDATKCIFVAGYFDGHNAVPMQ
jgi:hypothetical protein